MCHTLLVLLYSTVTSDDAWVSYMDMDVIVEFKFAAGPTPIKYLLTLLFVGRPCR